jgi:hypothetical protein
MVKNKYFKTVNLNLAVYLFTQDQQIVGINPISRDQKEFSFIKTPHLEELEWLWMYGDRDDDRLLVSVHKYERARKELIDRLLN